MDRNKKDNRPLMVSICCTAYNQEEQIRECLDGFVMQQTNFRFEAVVHDDASTDGTATIIKEYAEKYPDIIKPILETENQYSKHDGSLERIMNEAATGKYVAWCEGDDCWIDPLKLQKQVDYLESHPDCMLVHTDMEVKDVNTGEVLHGKWKKQKNFNLIQRNFGAKLIPLILAGEYSVTTLTVCARRTIIEQCEKEGLVPSGREFLMGDTTRWIALASKGEIHLIPDVCACYHVVGESATHSKNYSNVITFYVSCFKMIDYVVNTYKLSNSEKEKAVQEYIYFLLRDVYLDKKDFLQEVKDRILKGRKLNFCNALLLKTMSSSRVTKKIINIGVRGYKYISHQVNFGLAKYFGIV